MTRKQKQLSHPPSRNLLVVVLSVGWCTLALIVLRVLASANVTLGQGSFFYRYSELESVRVLRCWPVFLALPLMWLAIVRWRWLAIFLAILLAGWTWWAPPRQMVQHSFNMRSPSHDGAFLLEADHITSLRDYLLSFDERIQKSPAQLKGTRVISNPPGMTIFAVWVNEVFPPQVNPPGIIERELIAEDVAPDDLPFASKTIRLSIALTVLWLLGGFAAYALGRLFLPPPGALVFAIITCFNPSTLNFSPGKDSAQLLTICAMMACWFAAIKNPRLMFLSLIAGSLLIVGLILGLIHGWIALAMVVATLWETNVRGQIQVFAAMGLGGKQLAKIRSIMAIIGAILGATLTATAIYCVSGWNPVRTIDVVYRRFIPIQKTFALDRTTWFFIGLPIFLLFVSPGLVTFIGLAIRRRRLGLGAKLLTCTLATMLITYLSGITYELPRLWIAFLPALTLGSMIDLPIARARHGRALRAIALIAIVAILAALMHWSYLDVRESEYRLISRRFFN